MIGLILENLKWYCMNFICIILFCVFMIGVFGNLGMVCYGNVIILKWSDCYFFFIVGLLFVGMRIFIYLF